MTSEHVSGGRKGASPAGVWEETVSGKGSGRCKGPGVGVGLASSGTREASVAGATGREEGRGTGGGLRSSCVASERLLDSAPCERGVGGC